MDNINNFSSAVKRHSEQEREEMLRELDAKKKDELDKAARQGKLDAEHYISRLLSEAKAKITGEYAVKNLEADAKVFMKRDDLVKSLFHEAERRLIEFSESGTYAQKLLKDTEEIAEAFKNNGCEIYLKESDLKYSDEIKEKFNSNIEIKSDPEIIIGGLRGYCPALKIVADNTLDTKLAAQREWFTNNSKLSI